MFKNLYLYIPVLYSLKSRGISSQIIFGPFLVLSFLFLSKNIILTKEVLIFIIFNYLFFRIVYEIGYIINDNLSIKTEKKPTLRTDILSNKKTLLLILIRMFSVFFLYILLFYFFNPIFFNYYKNIYFKFLLITLLIFLFHNFIHIINIKLRLISFTFLYATRWVVLLSYFLHLVDKKYTIMTIIFFIATQFFYTYTYGSFYKNIFKDFLVKIIPKNTELAIMLLTIITFLLTSFKWWPDKSFLFFVIFISLSLLFLAFLRLKVKFFIINFLKKSKYN